MREAQHDYYVFPRVVPAGRTSEISVIPRGRHASMPEGTKVPVKIIPLEHSTETRNDVTCQYPIVEGVVRDGALRVLWRFDGEQEHTLSFHRARDNGMNIRQANVEVSVYSLEEDLYAMRPFRGNLHIHTDESDGREAPEVVCANYRSFGYDFIAITDHHRMYPSYMAIDAFQKIPTGLRLFPGEEVHTYCNHIHIVNFGGTESVNLWADADKQKYYDMVEERAKALPALDEGVNRHEYASCLAIIDKIREHGGIAIYAHPHWKPHAYHVPDAMTWQIFKDWPFDAFELLGGQSCQENNMQTLIYNEARARGYHFPVVGSSDSHNSTNTTDYKDASVIEESTIVMSPNGSKESILASIKARRSAAVEQYRGEQARVYGEYRIGKLAMFLLAELFPQHDEICAIEGGLMKLAVGGDENARNMLAACKNMADEYVERCYANTVRP